jgi:hypothetical protein
MKIQQMISFKKFITKPIINEITLYYTIMQFPSCDYQTTII